MHKRLLDDLVEVDRLNGIGEHLVTVAFPVVKDAKLLLRGLDNVHKAFLLNVSVVLKIEHFFRRINLTDDKEKNFGLFFQRCALRYGLNEEDVETLKELISCGKRYKESGFDFTRSGKAVVLDDDLGYFELNFEKMKDFVQVVKKLLENTNRHFRDIF